MALLFGFKYIGQMCPNILSVHQTIHQVKARSQKEHVSAQNHVSIKRLITTFQLEKQTEELFWMPEKSFKALMCSQYCKHAHITTFETCCKIHFQFYNLKAMKRQFKYIFWVVVSYLPLHFGQWYINGDQILPLCSGV